MQIRPNSDWWRALVVAMGLVMALGLTGCGDDTKSGEDDTCTGFGCGDFFRDIGGDTGTDATVDTSQDTSDTPTVCEDGVAECLDPTTLRTCVNGQWDEQNCIDPDVCDAENAECTTPVCPVPGLAYACESETQERVCGQDQLSYEVRDCLEGDTCTGTGCNTLICNPNDTRCDGADAVEVCNEDGTGWEAQETCGETQLCSLGECKELCELNEKTASFLGCEYYVVDLDNTPETDDQPFGITVSNRDPEITASVQVTGGGMTVNDTVGPGQVKLINLPANTDVEASGIHDNATFYVQSSIPVTVHQFNPLNGDGVFSNDASLLLPTNAIGQEYIALNWPTTQTVYPEVYVDVVGVTDSTTVTITSPVTIPSGPGFNQIPANTPTNITLNAGQLLHLVSAASGADMTGLRVSATAPVSVFAGTRCAVVPDQVCCCDHTEQQLFPVETWGTSYVAAKSFPRGTESDYWRIVASVDNTTVTITPTTDGQSTFTLNAGEAQELTATTNFEVDADQPVLVGQFWAGSNADGVPKICEVPADLAGGAGTCDAFTCSLLFGGDRCEGDACVVDCLDEGTCDALCTPGAPGQDCRDSVTCGSGGFCVSGTGIGDPAYSLTVPVAQYRSDYIVLTPTGYQENYMTVVAPSGNAPIMDGARITEAPINASPTDLNGEWDVYRFPVGEGAHLFQDNASFGVMAYGYNCDVSYAYPGGLNLEIIN